MSSGFEVSTISLMNFIQSGLRKKPTKRLRRFYDIFGVPRYNITSSRTAGYTWFRVAKCGTRTILSILQNKTSPDVDHYEVPYLSYAYANSFKFCFIRNPWDRLVSCYVNKVVRKVEFEECWDKDFPYFVRYVARQNISKGNIHFRKQVALFPKRSLDYVGRFENFNDDLNYVLNSRLGLDVQIGHRNKSVRDHYTEYYDDDSRNLVAKLYKGDIEFGSYSFG